MSDLKIKLMLQEAEKRYKDGEFLDKNGIQSDSGYLLKLLSFELYLKSLLLVDKGSFRTNHNYYSMYCSLARDTKQKVVSTAQELSQIFDIGENIEKLLKTFESNFVLLRYPFQNYANMNEKEYIEYSDLYASLGCPDGEAEFEYYPNELYGLTNSIKSLFYGAI